jgi:hypothetical protein
VADIGFNAILQRANHDLMFLLAATGDNGAGADVAAMVRRTGAAVERSWHEEDGFYYSANTRAGMMIRQQPKSTPQRAGPIGHRQSQQALYLLDVATPRHRIG